MKKKTEEKLASSLTAENIEIIPYLPYLLQDIWDLSGSSKDIIKLINNNIAITNKIRVLDLAGGKGGVSIPLAKELKVHLKLVDIIPEFIEEAREKAKIYNLKKNTYELEVDDANNTVINERNWDLVLFCGAGNILGSPEETISKLSKVIKSNGHIIFDEAYTKDNNEKEIKYKKQKYLTYDHWIEIFKSNNLEIVDKILSDDKEFSKINKINTELITKRAEELKKKYPKRSYLFDNYIKSQKAEVYDLENNIMTLTWLLKKKKE